MTLLARIGTQDINGTALYRDFVSSSGKALEPWLAPFGADTLKTAIGSGARVDGALVSSLRAANQALGVNAAVIGKLAGLADGSARVVVTGQQPGVAGGPLMSLHKAAAAIALARRTEAESGRACVPVFWLGSDDDDFSEVRELCVIGADYLRLDVSMDASAYRPGLRVGDMDASAVRAVWNAVAPVLPAGTARDQMTNAFANARDFGDAAARALVAATHGQIIVVDGRAPELRIAGRDLLLGFFDREARLRELLEAGGRELEARGYHTQVQWGSDSGLFLVRDGVRQRVPPDRRAAVRAEFERDITQVSPGVVARNLLQDAVLAPVAVVLGPAEIAYRAQMAGVYRDMRVTMPVVLPRFSGTYVPPAVSDMVNALGLDAAGMASDPARTVTDVGNRSVDDGFQASAKQLEDSFATAARAFIATASARLDERAQQKLQKRIDELSSRLAQTLATALEHDTQGPRSRWPFLPRTTEMFVKDTVPQERFLSLLTPMLFHGDAAWTGIDAVAEAWARDLLDGRVWHGVYSA